MPTLKELSGQYIETERRATTTFRNYVIAELNQRGVLIPPPAPNAYESATAYGIYLSGTYKNYVVQLRFTHNGAMIKGRIGYPYKAPGYQHEYTNYQRVAAKDFDLFVKKIDKFIATLESAKVPA